MLLPSRQNRSQFHSGFFETLFSYGLNTFFPEAKESFIYLFIYLCLSRHTDSIVREWNVTLKKGGIRPRPQRSARKPSGGGGSEPSVSTSISHLDVFVRPGDIPFHRAQVAIKVGSRREALSGRSLAAPAAEGGPVREGGLVRRCEGSLCPLSPLPPTPAPAPAGLAQRKAAHPASSFPPSQADRCEAARLPGRGWDVEQQILVWS